MVPLGMWHQFGLLPDTNEKGIFFEVSDIEQQWLEKRFGGNDNTHFDPVDGTFADSIRDMYNLNSSTTSSVGSLLEKVKFNKK